MFMSRVTQVYDVGACIYFYFGFNYRQIDSDSENKDELSVIKGLHVYEELEVKLFDKKT